MINMLVQVMNLYEMLQTRHNFDTTQQNKETVNLFDIVILNVFYVTYIWIFTKSNINVFIELYCTLCNEKWILNMIESNV